MSIIETESFTAHFKTGGIIPAGHINITDTNVIDVARYATAQVVDANLIPENIAEGITILGIEGTHQGGGGSSSILSITQGKVSTPFYGDSAGRHGQSGDLPTLTVSCDIPATATIQQVKAYYVYTGLIVLGDSMPVTSTDMPVYSSGTLTEIEEYSTETVGDNIRITVTSPTDSFFNRFISQAKYGQMIKSVILIVTYSI